MADLSHRHYQHKSKDLKTLGHLLKYIKPYKKEIFIVIASLIIVSSAILGLGQAIKYLIDGGIGKGNPEMLNQAFLYLVVIIVLLSGASYTRSSFINIVCEKIEADIRKDVYKHIIRVSPGFFEINKTSDTISRLTVDTNILNSIIASVASFSLRNILMTIGGIIFLFINSAKLALYVIIILPLVLIPIIFFGRKIRILSRNTQDKISDLSSHIEESLNGIKTVQSFNREEYEYIGFENKVTETLDTATKRLQARSLLFAAVIALVLLSITAVLWVGGHDVLDGKMSAGELSSFIFYSIMVALSIGGLSEVIGDLHRAAAATERIVELLDVKSDIEDPRNPKTIPENKKLVIELKNVTFAYPARPDYNALADIKLSIKPGQTIALVGPSGSGKTTIFQLLLRFYDPSNGEIKIGGINIKDTTLNELRHQFAIVPQDPVIFSQTAFDNIKYGNHKASEDEVRKAAKAAEILDFLDSLPQGIHTYLGEKGVRISGGQKQRIAIARAILKNPKILLLDEATSALDSENEKLVQKALANLGKGRTTLVIAHRISTIKGADSIIVLDNGKIEAQGTHKELLKKNDLYKRLAATYE